MKVAIISDVHNNTTNLKKVLDFCAKESAGGRIEKIICCGDLASDETLDFLNDNFEGEIYYIFGNAEEGQLDKSKAQSASWRTKFKRVKLFEDFGEAEIADKKVAFVHYPREAKRLAESGKYEFVFYGHTHKPWVSYAKASEDQASKKCTILNPGNVAGEIYPPTFAVWNTDSGKFELMRIHDLKF